MSPRINIILDNQMAVFFSGQTITGRVEVNCSEPVSCRGE